jgi:hypothetical protein
VEEVLVTTRGDDRIEARLDELARADRGITPPEGLEARVLQAWDQRAPAAEARVPRAAGWPWVLMGGAMAASLVAGLLVRGRDVSPVAVPRLAPVEAVAPIDPDLQWLDDDPASLRVVRLRVTRDALQAMGMTVNQGHGADVVEVELIVGPEGARRAARLVPASAQEEF